ncbi:hypothetical protein L2735_12005 [Shewanella olleyana]|uniref:hypothetical protein n=1 Tax=Shewanella olleyana TaxID=135626 RepID=UPI00200CEDFB|nr:hypothetical protein [Shewanella olleyana]MCL1067522.1 hypothetical protein [Shewanella olleyana]
MKLRKITYRFLSIVGVALALTACSDDGPMEQAGEKIDEAAEDTRNAIEDSCEKVKEELGAEDEDC